jgi:DNA-binding transcriptional MocR family regulator
MIDWESRYAARAGRMAASEIRELLKIIDDPAVISFAGGIPDPALFSGAALAAAHRRILEDPRRRAQALQYSQSEGYPPLRQWIARYMAGLGVACGPEHVLITAGAQQALDFLAKLFISAGDAVLVARPTYLGALQAMSAYEPVWGALPRRGDNCDRAPAGRRRALGYVMPDFQNPTGESLDLEARLHLLDAARALDLPLVEDGAYSALRYDGAAHPPLLALDAKDGIDRARVLYCGTFSKIVAPGLRLGWVAAPQPVIRRLVLIKQASDLHSPTLAQMAMHEVIEDVFPDCLAPIRATYRARRDAMLAALRREMPEGVRWTEPEGGMFIWLMLPGGADTAALLVRAVGEARVARPGPRLPLRRQRRAHAPPQLLAGGAGADRRRHRAARRAPPRRLAHPPLKEC